MKPHLVWTTLRRSRRRAVGVASIAIAIVAIAPRARAACPSYTPAETSGGQNCGVNPVAGTNPGIAAWKTIFATVAPGQSSWGTNGPSIGTIGAGCGKPTPTHAVPAHFPCHMLEAITMVESGWRQFCVPDSPAGSVGAPSRTIVSFDCGYGIAQVTSGMHVNETPAFDRNRVAGEPTYNLATGTLILRDKWIATNCVGDNNPDLVEDWYTAIWAYNGLAYSNNPNNPNLTANRGPYNPANGGSYAYQEKVFGWMEHPPSSAYWSALAPAYPNRADVGTGAAPPALPEPNCASPTSCTSTRKTHASTCDLATPDAGAPDADAPDAAEDAAIDAAKPRGPGISGGPGGDGTLADTPQATSDSQGCSCRSAGERQSPIGAVIALAAAMLARARRARRSR
jgi:hypothetical protein